MTWPTWRWLTYGCKCRDSHCNAQRARAGGLHRGQRCRQRSHSHTCRALFRRAAATPASRDPPPVADQYPLAPSRHARQANLVSTHSPVHDTPLNIHTSILLNKSSRYFRDTIHKSTLDARENTALIIRRRTLISPAFTVRGSTKILNHRISWTSDALMRTFYLQAVYIYLSPVLLQ